MDPRLGLDDLAERPERHPRAVRKTAAVPPRDDLLVVDRRSGRARRRACSCRFPGRRRASRAAVERSTRTRAKAPRGGRARGRARRAATAAPRRVHRDAAERPRRPPTPRPARPSPSPRSGRMRAGRRSHARSLDASPRRRGSRRPARPTGCVRRCSSRRPRPSTRPPPGAASSATSASPVATPTRTCRSSASLPIVERRDRVAHCERRANGTLRVVLVGGRCAVDGDDGVADELLDGAAVALELAPERLVVPAQERAHVLRIEPLGPRRRADEVDEHRRDDLALLARRRHRAECRTAAVAEPRVVRVLTCAPQAGDHAASVRRREMPYATAAAPRLRARSQRNGAPTSS